MAKPKFRVWLDEQGAWGNEVYPDMSEQGLRIYDKFTEELSTAALSCYSDTLIAAGYTLPLKAWTKIRIIDDLSETHDYIISGYDDQLVKMGHGTNYANGAVYRAQITCVELVKLTQAIFPDSLSFSNGLDASTGEVTTRTIGELLARVNEQLFTLPYDQKYVENNVPFAMVIPANAWWYGITAPEMNFVNCSLFEILEDVGRAVGGYPYLTFFSDGWYRLNFRMWQDNSTAHYTDSDVLQVEHHQTIEGNANVLVGNLKNLQNMSVDGENTVVEPCYDKFMPVCTEDYTTEITNTGTEFKVSKPIAKVTKMVFSIEQSDGVYTLETDKEYPFLGQSIGWVPLSLDSTIREYSAWSTLPQYAILSYISESRFKDEVLYYNLGSNVIANVACNNTGISRGSFYGLFVTLLRNAYNDNTIGTGTLSPRLRMRITYIPYQECKVKAYKQNFDGKMIANTYNQMSNVVSSAAIANNMQGLVDRLEGEYHKWEKAYKLGDDVYKIGEWLNGYIIVQAEYEIFNNAKYGIYTVAPFNRRCEFLPPFNKIRLWAIPNDAVIDRDLHYGENIEVSIHTRLPESNGSLTYNGRRLLTSLTNVTTVPVLAYLAWKDQSDISADADTDSEDYALAPMSTLSFGRSIIMTWDASDNVSVGNRVYNKSPSASNYRADIQNYIQYNPTADHLCMRFSTNAPSTYVFDNDLLPLGADTDNANFHFTYPASNKRQYADCYALVDFGNGFYIAKDLREKVKFNFQLDFIGKNGTIVYERAVTLNRLSSNNAISGWKVYIDTNTPYSQWETKIHNDATLVVGAVVDNSPESYSISNVGTYNNLAVTDSDNNLLFATNVGRDTVGVLSIFFSNRIKEYEKL